MTLASFRVGGQRQLKSCKRARRKNTLIILVAYEIWKHINACVFNGVAPSVVDMVLPITNEGTLWRMAGASKPQELSAKATALVS